MKLPAFLVRGFRPPGEALTSALGALERQVMELLWSSSRDCSVWDVHAALDGPAYTTLMTTLDRLHKKGLLARHKQGRAFLYTPRIQRDEFEHALAASLIGGLLASGQGVRPLLSTIVAAVSARDHEALDQLEELVRERRRALKAKERRP